MLEQKKPRNGFTLTELLVVILIVGMLATIVIIDFRRGKMRDDLRYSAQQLAASLQEAQNLAMTGRVTGSDVPEGGYGIVLDTVEPSEFKIFADQDNNHIYEAGSDDLVEGETIMLADRVTLIEIEKVADGSNFSHLNITFPLLEHSPFLCQEADCSDQGFDLLLTLEHSTLAETKQVKLYGLTGQVELL